MVRRDLKDAAEAHPGTAFRARWAAVNAVQDAELRDLSASERLDQLLDLYDLRAAFRDDPMADEEDSAVRERWKRLRGRQVNGAIRHDSR